LKYSTVQQAKQRGGTTVNRLLRIVWSVALAVAVWGCGSKDFGIESVSPNTGSLTGGDSIQVFGGGFSRDVGMTVYFGSVKAENVVVRSESMISVSVPPSSKEGKVDIRIVTDDGKELLLKQAFAYVNKTGGETKELQSIDQRKDLRE
jgi:hypothetical protein